MLQQLIDMGGTVISHVVIATIVAVPIAAWNYGKVENDVAWIKKELIYQRNKLDKLVDDNYTIKGWRPN